MNLVNRNEVFYQPIKLYDYCWVSVVGTVAPVCCCQVTYSLSQFLSYKISCFS